MKRTHQTISWIAGLLLATTGITPAAPAVPDPAKTGKERKSREKRASPGKHPSSKL